MREYIKTIRIRGKLDVEDKYKFEDVRGEYKHDIYTNKGMVGFIYLPSVKSSFELMNSFSETCMFTFIGEGITINGEITGIHFGGKNEDRIDFDIIDVMERLSYDKGNVEKIKVFYKIPYISLLAREIDYSMYKKEYIIKYNSEEFKINVGDIEVCFYEFIKLTKHKKPDSIFHRTLYPKIEIPIIDNENTLNKLSDLFDFMYEVMVLISFIIYKRCNVFGYEAEILGESNNLLQKIEYKTTKHGSGEDYIEDDNRKFNNYFIEENISKLAGAYMNLSNKAKENYLKIIYAYLTIGELEIMEPMFKDAYHLLEAISKIIVEPKINMNSERLIEKACVNNNIDLNKIRFEKAKESNKLKWLITEYRNSLIHFNYDFEIKNETLMGEFYKMMNLVRKLMLSYLVPSLIEFPYPRDRYRLIH